MAHGSSISMADIPSGSARNEYLQSPPGAARRMHNIAWKPGRFCHTHTHIYTHTPPIYHTPELVTTMSDCLAFPPSPVGNPYGNHLQSGGRSTLAPPSIIIPDTGWPQASHSTQLASSSIFKKSYTPTSSETLNGDRLFSPDISPALLFRLASNKVSMLHRGFLLAGEGPPREKLAANNQYLPAFFQVCRSRCPHYSTEVIYTIISSHGWFPGFVRVAI